MNQPSVGSRSELVRWSLSVVLLLFVGLAPLGASGQTDTTAVAAPSSESAPSSSEAPVSTTSTPAAESTSAPTTAPATTATTEPVAEDPSAPTTSVDQPATSTTLSAEQQREKATAVANLDLARAADLEIKNKLRAITEEGNLTIEKIEAARQQIERAEILKEQAAEKLEENGQRQLSIESSLEVQAIEGYKSRSLGEPSLLFASLPVNESLRQHQLLDEAHASTTELLDELRILVEASQVANAQAQLAAQEAQRAEQILQRQLETQKAQVAEQQGLKAEVDRRLARWEGALAEYAKEDAGIQDLIGERTESVNPTLNNPTVPSQLGFQWPLDAPATSEYGYRTHPVYGTRRLHAGIDLGAPQGTPIAASNDGVVIFVGTRGGYGRTVIVDHGGSVTTLYAHMTDYNVADGAEVQRGDIIGFVGRTGTATGNHLHFEVRVDGGPVNPRSYLP